jgi:hypothetical protein
VPLPKSHNPIRNKPPARACQNADVAASGQARKQVGAPGGAVGAQVGDAGAVLGATIDVLIWVEFR